MAEQASKPLTILGMPAMSVMFDGALTLLIIKSIFAMGAIQERIENMSRLQTDQAAKISAIEAINNAQSVSMGQTDAHYADIARRLDSIDRKLERVR